MSWLSPARTDRAVFFAGEFVPFNASSWCCRSPGTLAPRPVHNLGLEFSNLPTWSRIPLAEVL